MLEKMKMPIECLSVELAHESLNEEARTIDLVFYAGENVQRMNWWTGEKYFLQFSMDPSHVRLGRLNRGAPLLDSHNDSSLKHQLGVIERAWIEGGKGKATARFSQRADVEPVWQDVKNKIVRNISMGTGIYKLKDVTPEDSKLKHFLATDWEVMEISALPVGASEGSQFLKQDNQQFTECAIEHAEPRAETAQEKEQPMKEELKPTGSGTVADPKPNPVVTEPAVDLAAIREEAAKTERLRIDGIQKSVRIAGLDVALSDKLVKDGVSLDAARAVIFDKLAERSEANTIRTAHADVTRDADLTRLECMENQLLHRLSPDKVKLEKGKEFVSYSLFELCKEVLSAHGTPIRGLSKLEVVRLSMQSTSDFPNLLANVANKRLRQAYEENQQSYQRWARRAPNAPDFKQMSVVQLGANPDLLRTNEHGEFKYAKLTDGKEVYSMLTYGRILSFTRQAIINDDLRGFDRITTGFGASAARLENRTVYAQLTDNAALSDTVALFHATHANLAAASVISVASLTAGRAAMRLQKGLASEELNIAPRFLIAPATIEQTAYQFTSANYVPATSATINEFRAGGRTALEPVIESILDASSTSIWYLAADSSQVDTVEYCFLDGNEGVFLEQRMGFDVDGMELKARLDFAAKALDYRGLYRNG